MSETELLWDVCVRPLAIGPRLALAGWLALCGRTARAAFVLDQLEERGEVLVEIGATPKSPDVEALIEAADLWPDVEQMREAGVTTATFRGGLPQAVTIPLVAFSRSVGSLFQFAPLLDVRLVGAQPAKLRNGRYAWASAACAEDLPVAARSAATLSRRLWGRLPPQAAVFRSGAGLACYLSAETALLALSIACVDYGRSAARLPALS